MTSWPPYCSMPSVWISPAATQIARTPKRDHSFDSDAAIVSRAERAIEECAIIGIPRRGLNPRKNTTPRRRGIIQRVATSCVRCQGASTFSRCTARSPLSSIASAGAANWPPALFTRMSTAPKRSSTASRNTATCAGSRTSQGIASTFRPSASSSARTCSSGSGRRPQIATLAPVRASSRAVARPMPVPPPVTIATAPAFASAFSGERNPSSIAAVWRSGDVGCRRVLALRQPEAERFSRGGVG